MTGQTTKDLVVRQHSAIVYWWPIWVYGYFCAFWTFLYGQPFDIGGHKAVKVYQGPWLGLSFLVVLLIILWSSHVKARGMYSLVIYLLAIIAAMLLYGLGALSPMFAQLALLLVFMNEAFYNVLASGFLLIWILSVFVIDPMRSWQFRAGQVIESESLAEERHAYPAKGMDVKRLPTDFFVNKILGLAFLGGGTGDLELTTSGVAVMGGQPGRMAMTNVGMAKERILIENVWRAKQRKREIEDFIAAS